MYYTCRLHQILLVKVSLKQHRVRVRGHIYQGNSDTLCNRSDQILCNFFGHEVQSPLLEMKSLNILTTNSPALSKRLNLMTSGNPFQLKLLYIV